MAAACPAVDDVPSSLPPPKKPQHMTWAMSLASAYARIFSALESGRDVLAMPPVGSLRLDCYRQLVKQLTGITLIISSYKERMEKEIDILEKDGIPAAMLHSGLSDYAMAAQLERIRRRHFQVLFASPGLLEDPKMRSFLVFKTTISLIVIDEAQICSIHAPHFQPLYHSIPLLLKDLERHAASSRPPVLALTLPTTRQMEQDIGHFFSLQHPLLVRHSFECPNLFLSVHRPQRKAPFLLDFLRRHEDEAGIIYCTEHRLTEHIAQLLNRSGFPALSYHAGLTREERMANARAFCAGAPSSDRRIQRPSTHDAEAHAGARILVVTPDPFLELDRSDVRFVLHYTMPESLERYYQELVHAGRDGFPAECILLANERDFELQRTKLEKVTLGYQAYPEAVAQVKRQLEAMRRYAMTHQCLRSFLRDYFGGEDPVDYEVITLPSRNRVLTSAELPVDESLRTIRQSGHYPKNRVQKVSMQLKRAEKQHIFIRYADQAYMKNQAYKYEHLRTDPWELCEPGIRVQRFRAFSIPRDSCCVNCDPEHFLEEDRYGISDTMGLQERMREHRHQLETDMDVGRKIRLWKAGEKPYHFDYDAHTKCTGRIMAMRKVEYQKTAATMAAVLGQSSKSSIETPAHASTAPGASSSVPESPADDRLPATTPCEGNASVRTNNGKAGRGGYARGSDDEAGSVGYARTDDAEAGRGGYARTSDGEAEAQQLRLLENARLEISPEMRTHLLGNLKALRKRLAMERSVQAYLIFTDKSLVEMCRMLPLTREEFARIYGVGQRKLELHYEAFIDEIRKALDPAYVADFYENVSEEMQVDMQDGTGACVTGERTGMNDSADPVRVAEFYANASEEVQCTAGERTGMNDSVDAARVKRAPGTYAPSSNPVIPTSVIKPIPQERSESQRNPKYRFIPDDVLLAFLEEKYLQQRTRKQVKKKQDFFLTVAEAASFRCADGLRSPEIAALLNALVAEAEEISSTNSRIASIDVGASDNGSTSAAVATENPGETQTSNAVAMENPGEIQISDAVAAKNPGELTNQQKPRVRERKKLSGATINRKLAELGYLKLSEYRFNGRPHQTFLPTTKGEAAGIVLGTRKSQGGVDYPTAYFSAAAASWVATLFVRDETK
ncbi:MAG: HRDC domain-containing protein [Oribacterium sp.]|nr:HRDC domain-containing protein [Oribacterium sp.]